MKNKIVYESLNEVISFERRKDPLSTLGIGKRKLIDDWLEEMKIENCKINDDLTINSENVGLNKTNIIEFPEYIQFNEVKGYFSCAENQLISLRGCPKILIFYKEYEFGSFYCYNNQLTSLKGCPKSVPKDFECSNNKVKFTIKYVKFLCKVGDIFMYKKHKVEKTSKI